MHKIFKLCGSPSEEYWVKSRLPHATIFKPTQPYKRVVDETFKEFPQPALALLETLLSVNPDDRGTATSALHSEVIGTLKLFVLMLLLHNSLSMLLFSSFPQDLFRVILQAYLNILPAKSLMRGCVMKKVEGLSSSLLSASYYTKSLVVLFLNLSCCVCVDKVEETGSKDTKKGEELRNLEPSLPLTPMQSWLHLCR